MCIPWLKRHSIGRAWVQSSGFFPISLHSGFFAKVDTAEKYKQWNVSLILGVS